MEKISEIKAAIKRFQEDTTFKKVKARYEKDFDLYRLKPYDAGSGYYSYTSNAPRLLVNRATTMITESKLLIRVPEDALQPEARAIASNIERLLYGMLGLVDEANLILDKPYVIEQMAWHSVNRGGYAVRPLVYKDNRGETQVSMAVWDLYNTSYGIGKYGTSWAALSRKASKEEIKAEYDIDVVGSEADIIDFCDEKNIGVIVGNTWGDKLHPHGAERCPVYIIHAGTMPEVWQDKYAYANIHVGESIFANNRNIIPMINKVLSDYTTIIRRGVKTPLGYWSAGGKKTLEEDIYQVDKAAVVPLDSNANEKIEPLVKPTMPIDAGALLQIMIGEEQRGGVSHIAQGELGFRLSGFAINQLIAQLTEIIMPYVVCVEKGIKVASLSLLQQYAKGGWKPLSVRGRTSRNQSFGMPEAQVIAPGDVVGTWHPEIKLVPVMPKDDAQNATLAQMMKQNELLSLNTIQEDFLGVADTQLEKNKMSREWADNLLINRLYDAFIAAVEEGDPVKVENIRTELQRMMMGQVQPRKKPVAPGASQLAQTAAGMPGAGVPSGPTGVPSSTMPSEMMGGLPGGAMNGGVE